ncbi:hypothetical protein B0T10DRAFT_541246 [Neofusicoccum parvum]|uniref:Uncharacterized protein n=1 Tax=Neofusicoccum parvum TaxID=310453 RepID=A0ACB5S8T7_9PEZI|nr:hypothetical protein B0T10DRAFT_541246 [Neofusicoccum parvum]
MFRSAEWGQHHASAASLSAAADSGCPICGPLLRYALREAGTLSGYVAQPYEYGVHVGRASTAVCVYLRLVKDGAETERYRTFQAVPSSAIVANLGIRRREALPVSEAAAAARSWMGRCLAGHERCQGNASPRSYPTRLLELGRSSMRLVLPAEERPSGPYVALSYCWGANPTFPRLTASRLEEFRAGIPYCDLPIAFREAADFVKRLSMRYLWIDSLCIVQSGPGSIEDWHSESAKMSDVEAGTITTMHYTASLFVPAHGLCRSGFLLHAS